MVQVKNEIGDRVSNIKKQIADATSDYDKEKLQERVAKLSGGVAVLKVGAATEVELKEKKDRIEDALAATRAAVEEGIIAGGGLALFNAANGLDDALEGGIEFKDREKDLGVQIFKKALSSPIEQIVSNAGADWADVRCKLSEEKGYDAYTGNYVNMIKVGIIDPVKVTRLAVYHAVSIASMYLTIDAVVVDVPEKDGKSSEMSGGYPGGMGGMDGMM